MEENEARKGSLRLLSASAGSQNPRKKKKREKKRSKAGLGGSGRRTAGTGRGWDITCTRREEASQQKVGDGGGRAGVKLSCASRTSLCRCACVRVPVVLRAWRAGGRERERILPGASAGDDSGMWDTSARRGRRPPRAENNGGGRPLRDSRALLRTGAACGAVCRNPILAGAERDHEPAQGLPAVLRREPARRALRGVSGG